MKALTLYQPSATLVAIGAKRIETRSWSTSYRGPLAIHASKKFTKENQYICFQDPYRQFLGDYIKLGEIYLGQHKFPLGAIIATCELITCQKIDEFDWLSHQKGWQRGKNFWEASDQEKAFGDYTIGRYMWFLANIKLLPKPIYINGAMGLWDWEAREV